MNNTEIINNFLGREDLSFAEAKLKTRILSLNEFLNKAKGELQTLTEQTNAKQADVIAATHQLEGLFRLVLDLSQPSTETKGE